MVFTNKIIQKMLAKLDILFKSQNIIILIGVLSILPFLIISIYNHPASDDFWFFVKTIDNGYWSAQISWYLNWTGRYSSTAILSLYTLFTKSFFFYKLIPIILLISLFYSIYRLSSLLFLNNYKRVSLIVTFCIIVVYLIQMPSIPQGLYWLTGSITYQLPNILTIILLGFILKLLETNSKKYLALSIVFTILVIGSNEVSMLYIILLLGVIFVYKYLKHKKINYSNLWLLVFALLFVIIVLKSPGNDIRAEKYTNKHLFFYSVYKSFVAYKSYLGKWLPLTIIMAFIFYDYSNKRIHINANKYFDINPFFVLTIVCCIPFIGFFVTYWSIGFLPPPRTINTIFLYFLLGFLYLTLVIFFHLKKRNKHFIEFTPWVKYLLFIIILIHLGHQNNIRTAYSDLISGKAYKYDLELKNRYKIIENCKLETCSVPRLTNMPATIFMDDIRSNSKNWRNQHYQNFFNKKNIILEK